MIDCGSSANALRAVTAAPVAAMAAHSFTKLASTRPRNCAYRHTRRLPTANSTSTMKDVYGSASRFMRPKRSRAASGKHEQPAFGRAANCLLKAHGDRRTIAIHRREGRRCMRPVPEYDAKSWLLKALRETSHAMESLLWSIEDDELDRRPDEGEWSATELV